MKGKTCFMNLEEKHICFNVYCRKLVHGQCHEMKAKGLSCQKEGLMRPEFEAVRVAWSYKCSQMLPSKV